MIMTLVGKNPPERFQPAGLAGAGAQADVEITLIMLFTNSACDRRPARSFQRRRARAASRLEGGKDICVVWAYAAISNPFITETIAKIFGNVEEAIGDFSQKGYIK